MANCFTPVTCGVCMSNPGLLQVGSCALNIAPTVSVCGGSVGTASCGMPQVTIAGAKTNLLPWLIGGGVLLYLFSRRKRG
jgi:hypothetical protein